MVKKFDFGGWATKANLLCSDGRVIRENAFEECDGKTVPLIWNHKHDDPEAVLGHALLENRGDGVYAYCTFNDTDAGQNAKLLVKHGDVNQLSIYANKLKQRGREVIHGVIREVSLVLAGANSGARIDSVVMHSDDSYEEGFIYTGEYLEDAESLQHAEEEMEGEEEMAKLSIMDEISNLSDDDKKKLFNTLAQAKDDELEHACGGGSSTKKKKPIEHAKDGEDVDMEDVIEDDEEDTIESIINTMNDKQKKALYAMIGMVMSEKEGKEDKGGNTEMKQNVFDHDSKTNGDDVLTHSEMMEIMEDAKKCGSLAEAVLQHGIEQIDYLFPDAQAIDKVPGFIKRDDTWVSEVMNAVSKTPFSRIKSIFADITENDARAKGYIKGNLKTEEFFSLMKRITTPTTIYKKQKLDRDDVIDITDFDVVAWLKTEMRMMLDEEIARAILVGDGRSSSSNDKINEQNIRPIWTDDDVFTVKTAVNVTSSTTDEEKAKSFIKACIKSRKNYKGSGNPVMYMSEDMLTNCLLLEDTNQRIIYDTVEKLATTLRVRKIVPVSVMEDLSRVVGDKTHTLAGIYVNLTDYNVGADKGGAVNMFDDFDIDYNSQKYLIETRCSGALIKPYSAVAIEFVQTTAG